MAIANPTTHAVPQAIVMPREVNVPAALVRTYPEPILSTDQRIALRAQWKELVAVHTAKCREWDALSGKDKLWKRPPAFPAHAHFMYSVLLGRDWRKGYTRITNAKKVANGSVSQWSWWRVASIIVGIQNTTFEGRGPDHYVRVAPFDVFSASVSVDVQLTALRRVPALTTWDSLIQDSSLPKGSQNPPYPGAKDAIDDLWPKSPYKDVE